MLDPMATGVWSYQAGEVVVGGDRSGTGVFTKGLRVCIASADR
jgi:hypothetical protein